MAAAAATAAFASPIGLADGRAAVAAAPHCIGRLPMLPLSAPNVRTNSWKTTAYYRKIARNVAAMASGEVMTTGDAIVTTGDAIVTADAPDGATTEFPEIVQTVQEAWGKIEDKYAVTSLAFAGFVALWGSTGLISSVDRLPLVPGILELVGIGYTGWFAYRNLVFKPDRDALIAKIKSTYADIIGSS